MEKEYEEGEESLKKEQEFKSLPKEEQVKIITDKLIDLYSQIKDTPDEERKEDLKIKASLWQTKAKKRGIDWQAIKRKY
jgi:hypothetical protein